MDQLSPTHVRTAAAAILLTLSCTCVHLTTALAQEAPTTRHELWASVAYANGVPDRRDGFRDGRWVERDTRTHQGIPNDREYGLGLTYRYRVNERFTVGTGTAMTRLSQHYPVVLNRTYFRDGPFPDDLRYRRDYRVYNLQLSPTAEIVVLGAGVCKFCPRATEHAVTAGLTASAIYNLSYRRVVNDGPGYRVNRLDPFASELYPGAFIAVGRVRLDLQYRAAYWKYRDDTGTNNGLRVDRYNPAKMRLAVSYRISGRVKLDADPTT